MRNTPKPPNLNLHHISSHMSPPGHPYSKNKAPPAPHAASPAMAKNLSVLPQNAPPYPNALWYPLVITLVP